MKLRLLALLLPILVSLPMPARAVSQAGAVVDLFSPSARGAGMAHAGSLVPEGPFALRWNPAGVALDQPTSVGFTYNEVAKGLADDVWIYHLGGTLQWGPLGFGAMYSRLDLGEQLAFTSNEDALRLGAGVDVFDLFEPDLGDYDLDLVLGLSAKRFAVKLRPVDVTQDLGASSGGDEASAWTADAGAVVRFGKYLRPAIVDLPRPYVGVRASVVYDCLVDNELEFVDSDQSDPLPERLRYGFALEAQLFPHHTLGNLLELVLAYERLESKVERDFTQETHIGLEVAVANTLVLRGGSWDDPLGRIVGGTYGVGLRWARPDRKWNLQLDYANRPQAFGLDRIDLFSATVGYALFD